MTTVHPRIHGDEVVLTRAEWEQVVALARRSDSVLVVPLEDAMDPAEAAASGGAFDFWKDPAEDVYSLDDGEPPTWHN